MSFSFWKFPNTILSLVFYRKTEVIPSNALRLGVTQFYGYPSSAQSTGKEIRIVCRTCLHLDLLQSISSHVLPRSSSSQHICIGLSDVCIRLLSGRGIFVCMQLTSQQYKHFISLFVFCCVVIRCDTLVLLAPFVLLLLFSPSISFIQIIASGITSGFLSLLLSVPLLTILRNRRP